MFNFLKKLVKAWITFKPSSSAPQLFKVGFVNDGDTFQIRLPDKSQCTIRLYSIDAPERSYKNQVGQPFSEQATFRLKQLLGSNAYIEVVAKDRFGRTLALVYPENTPDGYLDGTSINEILAYEGLSWANDKFQHMHPKGIKIKSFGITAREEKKGLWSHPNPIAPYIWRVK